ncbi:MAG: site-2 protease family protein [Pseudomonadota bacterium]|nr:site-2 protease family protein [Pseudomonadota bacterium]
MGREIARRIGLEAVLSAECYVNFFESGIISPFGHVPGKGKKGLAHMVEWQWAQMLMLLFVALLVHEMGHASALSWYRLSPRNFVFGVGLRLFRLGKWDIHLLPLGGQAVIDAGDSSHLGRFGLLFLSLSGPVANFLCAIFFTLILGKHLGSSSDQRQIQGFIAINMLLGCLNLLPLPPFDGWNFVRSLRVLPLWGQTFMMFLEALFTIGFVFWIGMQLEAGWPIIRFFVIEKG